MDGMDACKRQVESDAVFLEEWIWQAEPIEILKRDPAIVSLHLANMMFRLHDGREQIDVQFGFVLFPPIDLTVRYSCLGLHY